MKSSTQIYKQNCFIQSLLPEAALHDTGLKTKTGNEQNKGFCTASQSFMQLSPHMGNQQPNKQTKKNTAKAAHTAHPPEKNKNQLKVSLIFTWERHKISKTCMISSLKKTKSQSTNEVREQNHIERNTKCNKRLYSSSI